MVVIIVVLVQLQAPSLHSFQTKVLISLGQGVESLVSTLVGALDLHNAAILLPEAVRDADQPPVGLRDDLLTHQDCQAQNIPQLGQSIRLVLLPVQGGRALGDFNKIK